MNLIPWHAKRSGGGEAGDGRELDVRREMARAFDRFLEDPYSGMRSMMGAGQGAFLPALDVTEDDKQVVVRAELPGVDPKNVDVTVSGNVLTLSGHKEESHEDKGRDYYRSERSFGSFRRRIDLPESVDPDRVSADYAEGVLSVRLEKKAGAAAKKIPVSARKGA
jgi:HSP20 family protein